MDKRLPSLDAAPASGCAHGCGCDHAPAPAAPAVPDPGHHDHDHDHDHGAHAGHHHDHGASCCGASPTDTCGSAACETPSWTAGDGPVLRLRVPAMDCGAEEAEIRRALEPLAGIRALRFDLGRRQLSVQAPEALFTTVEATLQRLGMPGERLPELATAASAEAERVWPRLAGGLAAAMAAEALAALAPAELPWRLAGMVLAVLAIALAGLGTYRKGLAALRNLRLNINALMTVAVTGAFVIGDWPEAAMVMALYAIAEWIEARAVDRARNAVRELLALAPQEAEVQQADGQWQRVATAAVAVGARLRLRPGERVPLDGEIVAGQGSLNQAPITGESLPVDKGPGDPVYAGSINLSSALELRVSAPADDSLLARITHAVEQAQGARAPTQRFVDRFAAVYTPVVFVLALAVAALGPVLAGWPVLDAVYRALVLLVIACPCALVISTPVTVVSALAAAARQGVLIKGGRFLEEARQLRVVALDKTGTLTEGRPRLVAQEWLAPAPDAAWAGLAQALAARSDHPVSQAIAAGLPAAAGALALDAFAAEVGRGVQARSGDGRTVRLANHRWVEELGLCSPALEARMAVHEAQGRSVSLLVIDQQVQAVFAVADTLRPGMSEAMAELQSLGLTPVMLTGDNERTAQAVAAQAGVAELRAQLLPEDKLAAIRALQQRLGPVAMVGDGINDAPALAGADIGVAMGGGGTHVAMEAADVVVMNDDPRRLALLVRLSRRTHAVLWQNIALALGIKAVFLALAVFDGASMWMAVFADMGASLLVVGNGLRLRRLNPPR
ncbi:heavy metal translocating P-type ATPase [Ideonella dechloratans]|uniref:heavy metal translocating P-type ATPase n=1 Tax=Ideonella dechloratans TaxID=36863 RepID=UPI0035B05258